MKSIGYKGLTRHHRLSFYILGLILIQSSHSFAQDFPVVQLTKRNASGFAIDGGSGGTNQQDVVLSAENENDSDQQWYEIDRGNGYFSYQKVGTDYCIDGNRGGANRQNVYLWTCAANNQNQHWLKVDVGNNYNRLEKRNASAFSLDGDRGGANGQSIYLWESNNNNANQHWQFNYLEEVVVQPPPPGTDFNVESLTELREMLGNSNQTIIMRPGRYNISELPDNQRFFEVTGNNNTIDMTGVHIDFPVNLTSLSHFSFQGSGNTFIGGTLENTYPNGEETITDFVSYNLNRDTLANGADMHFQIVGDNTTINDTKMLVRGSFPFGYGSIFGIGRGSSFGLI